MKFLHRRNKQICCDFSAYSLSYLFIVEKGEVDQAWLERNQRYHLKRHVVVVLEVMLDKIKIHLKKNNC